MTAAACADLRFLLPSPPAAADAIGRSALADALEAEGIDVRRDPRLASAELAVVAREHAVEAIRRGYDTLLVAGAVSSRRLGAAGYSTDVYLSLPSLSEPSLLVPLRGGTVAAYAVANWTFPRTPLRRARNRAARALLRRRALPPILPAVTVVTRRGRAPFLVAAAEATLGLPSNVGFFMRSGGVDMLARSTFFLFERAALQPTWLLKFARVRGYDDPFERDERGLALVAQTPAVVRRHAPELLGRFAVDGLHTSVETAAIGKPLSDVLRTRGGRPHGLALVEAVSAWILALGEATSRTDGFAPERDRLAQLVADTAIPPDLVRRLPELPTVLQHNDLGCWNVIFGTSFTAVDWESAQPAGLPMWDLWYFLLDALAAVDDVRREGREAHFRALFRGELETSRILFEWTRRAVQQHAVPPASVGALATLCWLHHGQSYVGRRDAVARLGGAAPRSNPFPFAQAWLGDPDLGLGWSRWQP